MPKAENAKSKPLAPKISKKDATENESKKERIKTKIGIPTKPTGVRPRKKAKSGQRMAFHHKEMNAGLINSPDNMALKKPSRYPLSAVWPSAFAR